MTTCTNYLLSGRKSTKKSTPPSTHLPPPPHTPPTHLYYVKPEYPPGLSGPHIRVTYREGSLLHFYIIRIRWLKSCMCIKKDFVNHYYDWPAIFIDLCIGPALILSCFEGGLGIALPSL